jgi:uncharacterized protein YjdB
MNRFLLLFTAFFSAHYNKLKEVFSFFLIDHTQVSFPNRTVSKKSGTLKTFVVSMVLLFVVSFVNAKENSNNNSATSNELVNAAAYCTFGFTNVVPITNVLFGTINNASSALTSSPGYEDFTSSVSASDVTRGQNYTVTVKGNTSGDFTYYYTAFFDWNNDGDFADAGESINIGTIRKSSGSDNKLASVFFQIPAGATLGNTRMRIIAHYNAYNTNPCGVIDGNKYGQVEDYTINIIASCSGTPVPGNTLSTANPICSNNPFTLSLQNATIGGATYNWQTSADGTSWTNAIPSPTIFFSTDFPSLPAGASVYGTSTSVTGGELILTPVNNNYTGGFVINSAAGSNITPFTASFDYRMFDGTGADGLSLSYASDIVTNSSGPGEEGEGSGLIVKFDSYDNDGGATGSRLKISYAGIPIFASRIGSFDLRNTSYRNVVLTVDANGSLSLTIAGTTIVSGLTLPGYVAANKSTWKFKFSARTGGSSDKHSIDNLTIKYLDVASTNPIFTTSQTTATYYRCQVTCGGITGTSTPVLVNMSTPAVTFTAEPGATACSNTDVTYTTQSGQTNYVWVVPGTLGTNYSISSGGIGSTSNTVTLKWLTAGSKTVTINYTNAAGCTATTATSSAATTVTATLSAAAITPNTAQNFCASGTGNLLTVSPTGGGTVAYQWGKRAASGGAITSIAGQTSATYTPSYTDLGVGIWYVVCTSTPICGGAIISNEVTVTINGPITTGVTICQGGSGALTTSTVCPSGFVNSGTTISGTWVVGDPTALRPSSYISNTASCSFDGSNTRNYVATSFQVSTTGSYTFTMTANTNYDGMGYIVSGSFVPGTCPGTGAWIKGDDDGGTNNEPSMTANLTVGTTYILISTTWGNTGTSTGAFAWTVTPPTGGQIMLQNSGTINWYTASSGGTLIGSGSPFNPVGVAGSGLVDTNTAGTTTFFAECSSSPGCRTSTTFVVNTKPTVIFTAEPGATACINTDVTYTTQAGQSNYVWVVPGTLGTDYSITSGGIGSGSNTVTLKWLTTGSKIVTINYNNAIGCAASTATSSIATTVNANASIASVTGVSPLCIVGTATYAANTVVLGGGAGAWSSSDTAVATVSAAGLVTGVSAGSANIIYTITGGCGGTVSAQQSVTVSPNASIASVTGTSPLCIAGTGTYTSNAVVLGGGTGAWSSSNTAVATVSAAGLVTGVSAGSANIIYTITGGCGGTVSAQQSVTVSPNASIASVTGTSPLCIAGTATYAANTVVLGGGTGTWSSSDTAVATVSAAGLVTGVSAGSANIIYTITGGCGGTVSAQQSVTISANASIASVTGTSPLCIAGTVTYVANAVVLSGGTGVWSSSNTAVATVSAAGLVTGVSAGSANIIYTITGGCSGTVSAQQTVTISPNASIASVTGTSPLCIAGTATYAANTVVLSGGTGAWSSSNTAVATVSAAGLVTGVSAGSANIIYTITGGCSGTVSAQQSVTVSPNASIASVTGTSPLCIAGTATYAANTAVLGGGTGAWSSSNTAVATVDASGVVTGVATGTTNIIYTITGGCGGTKSAQQSVLVNATPGAPVLNNVVLNCGDTSANGTWASIPNISNYRFDVSLDPLFGTFIPGYQDISVAPSLNPTETVAVNGLTPGVTYYARARTISSCGTPSVNSNTATISVPITTTTDGGLTWDNFAPDNTKKAVFAVGSASSVTMATPINACSVQINPGVNVVVGTPGNANTNAIMHIENGLTVDATSTLTFENNASLIQVNDNAVNNGKIIYRRNSTAMKNFDYTYWSSPVSGQTAKLLSPNTLADKYYRYDCNVDNWTFDDGMMKPGVGYIIRVPKPNFWPIPTDPTYVQSVQFEGIPNNKILPLSVGPIGHGNLIGNPYPSAMSADDFMAANSNELEGTIYLWTHNTVITNNQYSSSDFAAYNGVGGTNTMGNYIDNNNNGIFDSGDVEQVINRPDGNIAAGQSFFVNSLPGVGSDGFVTFDNTMRVDDSGKNAQFYRGTKSKSSSKEKNRVWLNLTNKQGAFKQMLVGYVSGATLGLDKAFDGVSFDGNDYIDFYSVNENMNLVIQGRPVPFVNTDKVPLGYKTNVDGNFTISIDQVDGVLVNQDVYIEDTESHLIQNLKQGTYTFTTLKGTFNNRFILRYTDNIVVVVPPVVVDPPVVVVPPVVVDPPVVVVPPVVVDPPVVVVPPVVVDPPVVVVPPVVVDPPVVVVPPVVVDPPVVVVPPVVVDPPVVVVPPVVVDPPVVVVPPVVVDPPVVVVPPVVVDPPIVVVPPVVIDPPVVVVPPVVVDPPVVVVPPVVVDPPIVVDPSSPNLENPSFTKVEKALVVSVKDHQIKINTFEMTMAKVMVYDLRGRLLYQNNAVNSNEFIIPDLNASDQFLIVMTQLIEGKWVTKEIIYKN